MDGGRPNHEDWISGQASAPARGAPSMEESMRRSVAMRVERARIVEKANVEAGKREIGEARKAKRRASRASRDEKPREDPKLEVLLVGCRGLPKAADASNPCISRSEGAVMGGCDVIAYAGLANASSDGRAAPNCTLGLEEYTETYAGFAFRFATADHQAAFAADPARYAPAYGGFCGYGMCCEDWWTPGDMEADVNPNVWVYVDGRLLSFRGHEPMEAFLANKSANLAAADARWEGWTETYGTPVFNTLCTHYGY